MAKKKKSQGKAVPTLLSLGSQLRKVQEREKKSEMGFLRARLGTEDKKEREKLEFKRNKELEKYGKEKARKKREAVRGTAYRVSEFGGKFVTSGGKALKKPTVSLPKKDPIATATKGNTNTKFVTEGEEGFFKKEYIKEKQNFLGGYSLWSVAGGVLKNE